MTQQAVTGLVPGPPAASDKPAEPGAGGDEALATAEQQRDLYHWLAARGEQVLTGGHRA
jgi:hypothetical protein